MCKDLRNIEICSPNLVSYELVSELYAYTKTKLNGISSLIHLSLAAFKCDELLFRLLGDVSGCLSRLETLMLHTVEGVPSAVEVDYASFPWKDFEFPSLLRLRKLVLEIDRNVYDSILCFTPLLNAAPLLREIVLRLVASGSGDSRRPKHPVWGQKHECVKVLEIEGYVGKGVDMEMALYGLEDAVLLEKVVIDGMAHTGEDPHLLKTNLLDKMLESCFVSLVMSISW